MSPQTTNASSTTTQGAGSATTPRNRFIARKLVKLPCFMVEARLENRVFHDRETIIQELDDVLLPRSSNPESSTPTQRVRQVVVYGVPGVGKSQLAIQYAFTRKTKYDAIFWIDAADQSTLQEGFNRIATELGLDNLDDSENPVVQRNLAIGWLTDPKKRDPEHPSVLIEADWLIVFDNLDNPEMLDDYWQVFGGGAILVTSRDPDTRSMLSETAVSMSLLPFSEEVGSAFLRRITSRPEQGEHQEADHAIEISKKLAGLPLALSQMAGIISHKRLDFDEFLKLYELPEERPELYKFEGSGRHKNQRGSIASIYAKQHLKTGEARRLLDISAFLDPGCVHDFILDCAVRVRPPLKMFPHTKLEYHEARAELLKASLIQRNEGEKDFSMHRLVQDTVKSGMTRERILATLKDIVRILREAWAETAVDESRTIKFWRQKQAIYRHATSLQRFLRKWVGETDRAFDFSFALLLAEKENGWWLTERGNARTSSYLLDSALSLIKKYKDSDTPQSGDETDVVDLLSGIHLNLGVCANETNDPGRCLHHNKRFLQLKLNTGKEDLRIGSAYNQIGIDRVMVMERERACEDFKKSIEVHRKLGDGAKKSEKCIESVPMVNLGQTRWLLGDLEGASKILLEGLAMREKVFGQNDKESYGTGRFLLALGNVRWDQALRDENESLMDESEDYHRRALTQYQSSIGKYYHRTADARHRVAQHCLRQAKYDDARLLVDEALDAWKTEPDAYTNEIARTTFLKSRIELASNHPAEAIRLRGKAAGMRRGIQDVQHKENEELTERDFDELVTFWSR